MNIMREPACCGMVPFFLIYEAVAYQNKKTKSYLWWQNFGEEHNVLTNCKELD